MAGVGSALNTNIEVAIRPVTNQGMKGIHPVSVGPKRQVADRSYYMGQLRTKNAELQAEITRLRAEEENIRKGTTAAVSMDKKSRELQNEINQLKNTLSDYNFALSKATSGVDVESMNGDTEMLKEHNAAQSKKVDEVFLDGKTREQKANQLEGQIKQQLDELDQKLNAEPEKRAEYYAIREKSARLQEMLLPMQRELDTLQRKHAAISAELSTDTTRKTALKLQAQRDKLEKEKEGLLEEIRQSPTGSLPDEKSKLLNMVKTETAEIDRLQGVQEEVKGEIKKLKETIAGMNNDLQEYKGERAEKYKELEAKDREMQEFIDGFDASRADVVSQSSKVEAAIVAKLEDIGKSMHFVDTLQHTSQQQVQEMQGDLDFKRKQLDYSLSTHERLKNELDLRKKELEKVDNLDAKISTELQAITEKIKQNEESIKVYGDLDTLRTDADQRKRKLQVERAEASKLRDQMKTVVHLLTTDKYEVLRQAMNENECHASLQAQENKIRMIHQSVFQTSDFIKQKGSEADFLPIKAKCLRMCDDINNYIQKQLHKETTRVGNGWDESFPA
jgi:intraflagellar transport protein 74